jgi:hypothetical protein
MLKRKYFTSEKGNRRRIGEGRTQNREEGTEGELEKEER